MTIYQLPYFGEVSLLEQDYYEIEADINQADTQIILDIANINPIVFKIFTLFRYKN